MKLIKNINNNFDSIFEKKYNEINKNSTEMLEENIFYEQILEKTVAFRNKLLEKPKSFLKAHVNKKMKFPFIGLSIFGAVLSLGGYFIINMPISYLRAILLMGEMIIIGLALLLVSIKINVFNTTKKLFIESINNKSSIEDILNTPENIVNIIENIYILKGLFYKNKEEFENSLNTISNYRNLSKEDLDLFLKSFNKEELNFISSFLFEKFNENKIEAVVLDDLILVIEQKLTKIKKIEEKLTKIKNIEEIKIKEKEFKSLMSEYVETEEISNKQLLKSLL